MDLRAGLMGILFALMWSSAFATTRIIVADAPPLTALAVRFAISGALAVVIALALGQSWRLTSAQARSVVVFGLCQNALYLGLNWVAMQKVDASLAAIIAASMPLLVAVLGWALRGEVVSRLGLAGLVAGMAGVVLIMASRISAGADPVSVALCVLGALALAVATLTLRGASTGGNLLMVVGLQMLVGSVALAVVAVPLEPHYLRLHPGFIAAFIYQVLVPGVAATLLWFTLVQRVGAVRASTWHFLNPFFGVAIAALVLGESIHALDVLGVAIIMAGILAVQWSRQTQAEP